MIKVRNALAALLLGCLFIIQPAVGQTPPKNGQALSVAEGVAHRQQGFIQEATRILSSVRELSATAEVRARAAGELGITLLQARRFAEAGKFLAEARSFFPEGKEQARFSVYLGSLALAQKMPEEAREHYQQALTMAGNDPDIRFPAELNLAKLMPENERIDALRGISRQLLASDNQSLLSLYHFNLGYQASKLGKAGLPLAWQHLEAARTLALAAGERRLLIESLDALAQLYEDQQRDADALVLNREAIALAQASGSGNIADLLIHLEWRQGRILKTQGRETSALAAYQRAVEHIEAVRQDFPIESDDGHSVFAELLEPTYLGYIDLLLQQADQQTATVREDYLRRAIETMELIKQSEMQDFLGDRCSVEATQGNRSGKLFPGTAMLYPMVFSDRLELLMASANGIVRHTTPVAGDQLRQAVISLADSLRHGDEDYLRQSRQLHQWLLAPLEATIAREKIVTVVVIPDGVLRLLSLGVLHDGRQFAIEKYAVTTVTGLSMTNSAPPVAKQSSYLVSGVSVPGSVVEKLSQNMVSAIVDQEAAGSRSGLAQKRSTRALRWMLTTSAANTEDDPQLSTERLRKNLSLPGVEQEINAISKLMTGDRLLNADFSVDKFRELAEIGSYGVVHIASHGVFGGSAETSYILAHDDILTMNRLQSVLTSEQLRKYPIEILSLSACQTAEGNERAPLGISGMAIKAGVKSVLGTLWPVDDAAANQVMSLFYAALKDQQVSKAEALRQAQIALIRDPKSAHPFFWGPFVLIGNWL